MTALEANFRVTVGKRHTVFTVESELSLSDGVLILFGPSGAGKSLTLHALVGLLKPASGFVRVEGETLFDTETGVDVPAHKRNISYVPQHESLFPFRDVSENVAFGLPRGKRRRGDARVKELLEEFGIAHLARALPQVLSGGERKRVAVARALAVRPRLLLLDEPFSSIDHVGRATLYKTLREALARHQTPAVLVTHEKAEALRLGDYMVTFERGRTISSGSPRDLLSAAAPVVVSGQVIGDAHTTDKGRVEVTLAAARVEGPAELFASQKSGQFSATLRTPSEQDDG